MADLHGSATGLLELTGEESFGNPGAPGRGGRGAAVAQSASAIAPVFDFDVLHILLEEWQQNGRNRSRSCLNFGALMV